MKRELTLAVLVALVAVTVIGCAAPPPAPAQPAAGEQPAATEAAPAEMPAAGPRVLKVANTANITTWDPIKSFSTEAAYMANIYEQLLRINPPGSEQKFTPLLAESWEANEDGTAWTFHLRPGVKFHDGEPLTGEAVKKSIEAAAERGGASFIWWALEEVEVVDDLTVVFHMSSPQPVDLIASSLYGAWIVSPKALDAAAADENYFEAGIEAGTGPYMLESYTPDQEILLTRFDDYWGGWEEGQFDKVLVQIVPEAVIQQQMLEGGEVDLVTRIPQENYDSFRERPGYSVITEPSFFNYVGFFNTLRPPLDNPKVRQALSYAIPYEDIIAIGAKGLGTQSRGPVPAGVWPWSPNVKQYTYDLDKARELLAEAGYPDGGFKLVLTYAAENATEEAFAPLIKDSFAQLGVEVEIEPLLFSQQWEKAKSDPPNAQDIFLLLYWPTYSDAGTDNLWSMFHSSEKPFFNLSYWQNEEFDRMIEEAASLTVTDPEKAQKLYEDAMNLLVDEAPGIFFFDTMAVFIIPDHIKGFRYNLNYPFVHHWFYELRAE
ncbi:MAG: ABC transporter substrate-binding protein [Chloroflexi bacterium]|nr:MAG: ABC transporter substrate-binding protein [Chloroflexota bacterium]